jgi:NADH:ubiquinone oxidoreductase subunit F (NADH-binding)
MTSTRLRVAAVGADLDAHLGRNGPLPLRGAARPGRLGPLAAEIAAAGLRGRGGGWFPTARKLEAVASSAGRHAPVVVVNGMEGEPLSGKDEHLLTHAPHLVLDGAALAAETLGAERVIVAVAVGRLGPLLSRLTAERAARGVDPVEITVAEGPERYLSGQETALINWINGGSALPTASRPFHRGVDRRATLVSNTETYAQLALIARHGAGWFRAAGTPDAPGTTLVTVSGAVDLPGVYEVPVGIPVGDVVRATGDPEAVPGPAPAAVLVGGYGGAWLAGADAWSVPLAPDSLRKAGTTLGPGILSVLPHGACGLAHTADITRWMADQGAGQCGPCHFGLPAVAADLDLLVRGTGARAALDQLRRRLGLLPGRGGCAHPDGTARLIASALHVFADEVERHLVGTCCETPQHTAKG